MKRVTIAGFLIAALALAACSADQPGAEETAGGPTTVAAGDADLLAAHDLDGLTGAEIVDALDQDPRERPLPVAASVFYDHVIVMGEDGDVTVPIEDEFYVSFAPYQSVTHPCTYHALGGCQGEMVGETFHVTITAEDGEVLVDEEATSYTNGFIGYWLPRDINATLAVSYEDGTSAETPISTSDGDATCVTTPLQLT